MNKKNKSFDCVRMKWDIQKKIEKEYTSLSDKEKYQKIFEKIRQNPILSGITEFNKETKA